MCVSYLAKYLVSTDVNVLTIGLFIDFWIVYLIFFCIEVHKIKAQRL